MKKYKIGYTQGVYDMFHIGHLNLLNNAKKYCDKLIVGVNADSLVEEYKHKIPVVSESMRREIVANIKAVDDAVIVTTLDKITMFKQLHFNAVFIGDDWKGTPRWEITQAELNKYGVDLIYLPYTQEISSTILREKEQDAVTDLKV